MSLQLELRSLLQRGSKSLEEIREQFPTHPIDAIQRALMAMKQLGHATIDGGLWHLTKRESAGAAEPVPAIVRRREPEPEPEPEAPPRRAPRAAASPKACAACGESKPSTEYYTNDKTCKACRWQRQKARKAAVAQALPAKKPVPITFSDKQKRKGALSIKDVADKHASTEKVLAFKAPPGMCALLLVEFRPEGDAPIVHVSNDPDRKLITLQQDNEQGKNVCITLPHYSIPRLTDWMTKMLAIGTDAPSTKSG